MVDLNGHEAGNGGYSQRKPAAHRVSSTRKVVIRPGYVTYHRPLDTSWIVSHEVVSSVEPRVQNRKVPNL